MSILTKKEITSLLIELDNFACLGLGSEEPKHWEASLQDILKTLRKAERKFDPKTFDKVNYL